MAGIDVFTKNRKSYYEILGFKPDRYTKIDRSIGEDFYLSDDYRWENLISKNKEGKSIVDEDLLCLEVACCVLSKRELREKYHDFFTHNWVDVFKELIGSQFGLFSERIRNEKETCGEFVFLEKENYDWLWHLVLIKARVLFIVLERGDGYFEEKMKEVFVNFFRGEVLFFFETLKENFNKKILPILQTNGEEKEVFSWVFENMFCPYAWIMFFVKNIEVEKKSPEKIIEDLTQLRTQIKKFCFEEEALIDKLREMKEFREKKDELLLLDLKEDYYLSEFVEVIDKTNGYEEKFFLLREEIINEKVSPTEIDEICKLDFKNLELYFEVTEELKEDILVVVENYWSTWDDTKKSDSNTKKSDSNTKASSSKSNVFSKPNEGKILPWVLFYSTIFFIFTIIFFSCWFFYKNRRKIWDEIKKWTRCFR